MHRHGIDDFVRDYGAADALGEALEPLRACPQPRLLARLELRADFDDAVVEGVLREERGGERAAAGAELEDRGAELFELPGERAAEERAELGRGDEVALAPKLLRTAGSSPARRARAPCSGRTQSSPGSRRSLLSGGRAPGEFNLEFKALMNELLSGKVALVTGGARRVGAAIARRLHAAGANVLLHYRDSESDAAKLEAELNAVRAKSAARVKAELRRRSRRRTRFGRGASRPPRSRGEQRLELPGRCRRDRVFALGGAGAPTCGPLFICQEAAPELASTGAIVTSSTFTPIARSRAIRSTASPRRGSPR